MSKKNEINPKHSSSFLFGYIVAVLFGLGIGGLILLLNKQPKPQAIKILPTSTNTPIIVHIVGEVLNPGIYEMEEEQRISDLIKCAGDVTENADLEKVNLASIIFDGQQIVIPSIKIVTEAKDDAELITKADDNVSNAPININYCTLEELIELPGIGQVKAEAILTYREEKGPFLVKEDIVKVTGIGESIFNSIKDSITVK